MQYEPKLSLPQPDAISARHSAKVDGHIRGVIEAAGGQIGFAEFMQEALYAPGLGYYSAGATKFGAAGDFITAPEVSAVFGRVVARQVAEVVQGKHGAEILEVGAGSGKLAADILATLADLDALPAHYNILEVSPDLKQRQARYLQETVPQLAARVRWLSELPASFAGAIIANEVLDALPAERFVRRESGVQQLCVSCSDETFVWSERPANERLSAAVLAIESELGDVFPSGFVSEISLATSSWIADLADSLTWGAALLFDYGVSQREYYAPERPDGWLRCHFRHHAHNDPLILPGIQDLTVWVDFSAVAAAAVAGGMDILGYQTQSQFLLGGGLELEMHGFEDLPLTQQLELSNQIKTLTLPGEMGENFKCIALGRGDIATPSAFQFTDRTQTL